MEFDVVTFLIGSVVGFAIAWRICNRFHENMMSEILRSAGVTPSQLEAAILKIQKDLPDDHEDVMPDVEVRIEQHGLALFAYRVDNNQFLGQGLDRDELIARIIEVNKTSFKMIISQENGAELLQKNNG
jgi:hypothetical protein